jgi:glycosyltransferase involved in cell wall biosynthesis
MRQIVIVVPSMSPTGPVKGAVALANALAPMRGVSLVALRSGPGVDAPIAPGVQILTGPGGFRDAVRLLRDALHMMGGGKGAVVISFCLPADLATMFARNRARWVSSIRGNLPRNYRFDFGIAGPAIAAAHLCALRAADEAVAMTRSMADQVTTFLGRRPRVIGNFVDEAPLDQVRSARSGGDVLRYVFLGSLSYRKQPLAVVDAVADLRQRGVQVALDIIGTGPLLSPVQARISSRGIEEHVILHGQCADPYPILAGADALVLPSLSEGVSRAALEALQLGVPVVMRDVDGSSELVVQGRNGVLFGDPGRLADAMLNAASLRCKLQGDVSLLPSTFRQEACARAYLELAEAE